MELVRPVVLLLHLIAFAALFGGVLVQLKVREPEINPAMFHGSYMMLLTGLGLAVIAGVSSDPVDYLQLGVKLLITLIITALVIINRRFTSIPKGLWAMLGALILGNAAVAVLWQ